MATVPQVSTLNTAGEGAPKGSAGRGPDAVALLQADHRALEKLFGQFASAKDDDRKKALADRICLELRVHMQVEEEILYPASREYLADEDIIDEAVVEHAAAKDLMSEIESMHPGQGLYDAKVIVLEEQVEHHVDEEEAEFFPRVQKTDLDLKAVGARMAARKEELLAQANLAAGKADQ